MKNLPLLLGTLVVTIGLIIGAAVLFSKSSAPKNVDQSILIGDGRHSQGPIDAKVTVVEFSDFQCPYCRDAEPIVQDLLSKHGKEIRFVYRQLPLVQVHKNAKLAAMYAEATTSFGKFWQMHDLLFQTQDDWAELSDSDARAKFDSYLDKLQIDKTELKKRIDAQETSDAITKDISDSTKAGVDATPTFYVNGQKVAAPQQLISTVESYLSTAH